MKQEQWQEIIWARHILELGERASLEEIKKAFRTLSKRNHPDVLQGKKAERSMQDLNRAYRILLDYCSAYRFPLQPGLGEEMDDEEWWMDRFGNDPLWGKNPGGA